MILVSSTPGIIPYNDRYNVMTAGTMTSGIYGGICNVTGIIEICHYQEVKLIGHITL